MTALWWLRCLRHKKCLIVTTRLGVPVRYNRLSDRRGDWTPGYLSTSFAARSLRIPRLGTFQIYATKTSHNSQTAKN